MGKNCSSDREKLLKFEAEGREFAKCLRSLEQFVQAVGPIFGNRIRGVSGGWAGWAIAHPLFGRIEGATGSGGMLHYYLPTQF